MAINASKVVVGGLVAGVVANIVGYVGFGMMLGPRFEAEAVAVAPALAGRAMTGTAIATQVVSSFVVGILLVWLYAAIRPRFGPGPKTAVIAAMVVWLCGFLFHIDWLIAGLASTTTYGLATVAGLAQILPAAWVGGMMYKEEGATAYRRRAVRLPKTGASGDQNGEHRFHRFHRFHRTSSCSSV